MTGNYLQIVARERIADLHREAHQERLATEAQSATTGNPRPGLLTHIIRRLATARPATT
jgi:hypothetical protein